MFIFNKPALGNFILFTSAFESSWGLASKLLALIRQFSISNSFSFLNIIYRLTLEYLCLSHILHVPARITQADLFHPRKHSPSFTMSGRFHTRFIVLIKQKGKKRSNKKRSSEIEFCKKLALKCFYRLLWKCLPL